MQSTKHMGIKLFFRYLCLIFPFLALSIFLSSTALEQMMGEDQARLQERLERVSQGLAEQFHQYYESSVYLAHMPELAPSAMLSSASNAMRGLAVLESVYVFDPLVDDLLIAYGDQRIYGANGMARPTVYLSNDMHLPPDACALALETLESKENAMAYLKTGENSGWVMFHYPIALMEQESAMSVNFCMSAATFAEFLQSFIADAEIWVQLHFMNGDTLLSSGSSGILATTEERAISPDIAKSWICASKFLPSTAVTIDLLINEGQLYANVAHLQWINHLLLVLGISASAFLAAFMANHRILQLKNLEAALQESPGQQTRRLGEFRNLHAMIQRTVHKNVSIIVEYQTLLKEQIAQLAFHGLLQSREELQTLLEKCGMELASERFFVLGAVGPSIAKEFGERHLVCQAEVAHRQAYLYLIGLKNADGERQLRMEQAQNLARALQEAGAPAELIIIGEAFSQLSSIQYAYLSVLAEIASQLTDGAQETIRFASHSSALQAHVLAPEEIAEWTAALTESDGHKAMKALEKMLSQISQSSLPPEIRRQICKAIADPLVAISEEADAAQDLSALKKSFDACPWDEKAFCQAIQEAARMLCAQRGAPEEDISQILLYIQENCFSADSSLEKTAAHFGMSREHLSRLFHAKSGMRYIDYITKLRMEAAWRLLTTTDLPVAEIFQSVGYIDRSSSTKKFKKHFGLTPAEARVQHRTP